MTTNDDSVTRLFLTNGSNHFNLFVPDEPFLYPLKTSENLKVF